MAGVTAVAQARRPVERGRGRERLLVVGVALFGAVVALVGVWLPWLSFFGGLHTIPGLDGLYGRIAGVLGVLAVGSGLLFAGTGRRWARWLIALSGFATMAISGWAWLNLFATIRTLGDPLVVAAIGPGTFVLAAGGALMFSTMFVQGADQPLNVRLSVSVLRRLLVVGLVLAGLVHATVAPEHLDASALIGGAMLAGGVVQLGLAALLFRTSSHWALAGSVVLNIIMVFAYGAAVTVGLPIEQHAHEASSLVGNHGSAGHLEPVTPLGLGTAVIEVVAAAAAMILLSTRNRRRPREDQAG